MEKNKIEIGGEYMDNSESINFLEKYFELTKIYPRLFANTGETGELRIILDRQILIREQKRIQQELHNKGKPKSWIDIGVLSEDQWFYVIRDLVEFPDGRIGGYLRIINRKSLEGGTNVVIMAIQGKYTFLLKHFRHETRKWYMEFPRGFGEPGLSPTQSAKTELFEETGLLPKELVEIGNILENDGRTIFFLALIDEGKPRLSKEEAIQDIAKITISELEEWILTGKITDWCTIMSFLMYKRNINSKGGTYANKDGNCIEGQA